MSPVDFKTFMHVTYGMLDAVCHNGEYSNVIAVVV